MTQTTWIFIVKIINKKSNKGLLDFMTYMETMTLEN